MSLLDGGRQNDLPTMSWESVLEEDERDGAQPGIDAVADALSRTPAFGVGTIKLKIPSFDITPDPPPPTDSALDLVARPILAPAPLPLPTDDPAQTDDGVSFTIPDIKEATPVSPLTADEQRALELSNSGPVPMAAEVTSEPAVEPPPAPEAFVPPAPPSPPVTPMAPPSIPSGAAPPVGGDAAQPVVPQPVVPQVAAPVQYPAASSYPPQHVAAPRPDRRRSGASHRLGTFVLTLVVVCGLVAAAVVFGRPYLFPDDWDAAVKPYAVAVEEALASEFVEPVTVTADPPQVYEVRRSAQLIGEWESQLPVWRALGLANGDIDQSALDRLLAGWSPAMYSVTDGQVYHDATLTGADLDAWTTFALAQAAIDQNGNWSSGQETRTLDGAAVVAARVWQQATAVQAATEFDGPIVQPDVTPLVYLPPVLGYRVVAPSMFVELLPDATGATGSLADATGLLVADAPALAGDPVLADGDVVVTAPVAQDRSFWFLAFASYLDAPQAFAASQAVVESSLAVIDRSGTTCAVATFSGGDVAGSATLGSALDAWTAAAPAELGSSTAALPDGSRQFTACDPGPGFINGARFGTARELIGFRLGEMATMVELDGNLAPAALARYEQSGVGAALAALPFDTTPADAAAAARSAVRESAPTALVIDGG